MDESRVSRKQRLRTLEEQIRQRGGLLSWLLFAARQKAIRDANPAQWFAYCVENDQSPEVLDALIQMADDIVADLEPKKGGDR